MEIAGMLLGYALHQWWYLRRHPLPPEPTPAEAKAARERKQALIRKAFEGSTFHETAR